MNTAKKAQLSDGSFLAYRQCGQGPDLLLLHGIGASSQSWRELLPHLSQQFRITTLDLAGFGESSKDIRQDYGLDNQCLRLTEFCKQLHLNRPHLLGCSMGGNIALWLKKSRTQDFGHVIVIGPAANPQTTPSGLFFLAKLAFVLKFFTSTSTFKWILTSTCSRLALIDEDRIESYRRPYIQNKEAVTCFFKSFLLLRDRRLPEALHTLQEDVLILWGQRDELISRHMIDRLLETIGPAFLIEHPWGGHHLMEDDPVWVSSNVLRFLSMHC